MTDGMKRSLMGVMRVRLQMALMEGAVNSFCPDMLEPIQSLGEGLDDAVGELLTELGLEQEAVAMLAEVESGIKANMDEAAREMQQEKLDS